MSLFFLDVLNPCVCFRSVFDLLCPCYVWWAVLLYLVLTSSLFVTCCILCFLSHVIYPCLCFTLDHGSYYFLLYPRFYFKVYFLDVQYSYTAFLTRCILVFTRSDFFGRELCLYFCYMSFFLRAISFFLKFRSVFDVLGEYPVGHPLSDRQMPEAVRSP